MFEGNQMIFKPKKIQVCCPHAVTGGPELLHQLVDRLRKNGHDASIVYLPVGGDFKCPEPYQIYNAPQSQLEDKSGVLVIVPEVSTGLLGKLKEATGAVWWLSVDNYFGITHESFLRDAYNRYKSLILGHRLPLQRLKKFYHFAQSYYAIEFLERVGIKAHLLGDYLRSEHINRNKIQICDKKNIIIYNPKKGASITNRLRKANPDMSFVAIQSMTPRQVAELLASAKLYIDFGHHPGKDRLPREAAMAECCVITGRRGSAANSMDVPIPEEYKLDDRARDFTTAFRKLALSVFGDYENHRLRFEGYRASIIEEEALFIRQIDQIFGGLQPSDDKATGWA